jgi:hypothetical protein
MRLVVKQLRCVSPRGATPSASKNPRTTRAGATGVPGAYPQVHIQLPIGKPLSDLMRGLADVARGGQGTAAESHCFQVVRL